VARCRSRPTTTAALPAKKGHLIYAVSGAFYYGRESDRKPSLRIYSTSRTARRRRWSRTSAGYALSPDGAKLLVREGRQASPVRREAEGANGKKTVSTAA
jgi:tricorn protease